MANFMSYDMWVVASEDRPAIGGAPVEASNDGEATPAASGVYVRGEDHYQVVKAGHIVSPGLEGLDDLILPSSVVAARNCARNIDSAGIDDLFKGKCAICHLENGLSVAIGIRIVIRLELSGSQSRCCSIRKRHVSDDRLARTSSSGHSGTGTTLGAAFSVDFGDQAHIYGGQYLSHTENIDKRR